MKRFVQTVLLITGLSLTPALVAAGAGPGSGGTFALPPQAKERLNLTPEQSAQWDFAVQQSRAAREAAKQSRLEMKDATKNELAKPEPDLAALAAQGDSIQARNQAARHAARGEWLKLYAGFSGAQKATVREIMLQRMARMEEFRQRMRERHPG